MPDDDANRRLVAHLASRTGGWIEARTLTQQQIAELETVGSEAADASRHH